MCLAVPGKIVEINGEKALVDFGGVKREADISLLEAPKVGDFVLVHVGFAIQKVDETKAKDSYSAILESGV
ncbi:HypC/HybG/HupF family hydrogenase formation chaperone [Candidatus Woesearchaeota archaeon]|nr:MAG: HypC/HybG/HupF family hydrogenase formation chaperone [Candidatus Woesearchaeota archaeon]